MSITRISFHSTYTRTFARKAGPEVGRHLALPCFHGNNSSPTPLTLEFKIKESLNPFFGGLTDHKVKEFLSFNSGNAYMHRELTILLSWMRVNKRIKKTYLVNCDTDPLSPIALFFSCYTEHWTWDSEVKLLAKLMAIHDGSRPTVTFSLI